MSTSSILTSTPSPSESSITFMSTLSSLSAPTSMSSVTLSPTAGSSTATITQMSSSRSTASPSSSSMPTPSVPPTSSLSTPTSSLILTSPSIPTSSSISTSSSTSHTPLPPITPPNSLTSSTPDPTFTQPSSPSEIVTSTNQATALSSTSNSPAPSTTFENTHFLTTTNSEGQITTSAPSQLTATLTSTGSDGGVITITEIGVNPTLSPDNSNVRASTFFQNTGAVVGVFVLVGLAAASIVLWIFFAVHRRRRTKGLEHETAVSATLTAAGFRRTPLDDDDDHTNEARISRTGSSEMNQRSNSALAIGTMSAVPSARGKSGYLDSPGHDEHNGREDFTPFADFGVQRPTGGYIIARTYSPPPAAFNATFAHDSSGNAGERRNASHSATPSAGSYEPLLTAYYRTTPPSSPTHGTVPLSPPPRSPLRLAGRKSLDAHSVPPIPRAGPVENVVHSGASSVYSTESAGDDRLDPGLRQRLKDEAESAFTRDLRDDKDYSRPVLGVRNMPDSASHES